MSDSYVVLLGTKGGPSLRPGASMPTSNLYVLGGKQIVVDCGLGVTKGLVDQGMHLRDLSLIFITHMHADHFMELGPLLHTAWTSGLKTPVEVFGPAGLAAYWDGFLASMQADIDLRILEEGRVDLRGLVTFTATREGCVFDRAGLTVSAIRTAHPPLVDCFALSFKTASVHVVCSGDTAPLPAMADFARGADLLVHEAMLVQSLPALMARIGPGSEKLMDRLTRTHSPAEEVGKIATKAGVKRLALSHLIPSDDPNYGPSVWQEAVAEHWAGPLFVGRDGLRIVLD